MTTPPTAPSTRTVTAAVQGRVSLPRCDSCERLHWYPKSRCPYCGSSWHWAEVSGSARVATWTEVHHDFGAESPFELPVTVVIAAMDAEPRVQMVTVAHTCLLRSSMEMHAEIAIRVTEPAATNPTLALAHHPRCPDDVRPSA
jgi:uncharacterized OB-fold protein